ncbi:hypothetical protein GCM10009828_096990 [Actinoplanes couchii]
MTTSPGTQYHHLARTPSHRWWRPILGTVVLLVLGAVVMLGSYLAYVAVAAATGQPDGPDGTASFGPLGELAIGFLAIGALLPVIMLVARLTQDRPAGSLSSIEGRIRWRWLLTCLPVAAAAITIFLAGGVVLSALTGVDAELDEPLAGWGPFLTATAVLLLVVPFQAAAEEYMCRGWLLQAVGSVMRRPWVPIVFQALVFAALHGWGTPFGFFDLAVFGTIAGWLTVRTGGLEAAITLHVMNNLLSSVIAAAFGQLTIDETAADMPWQMAAVDFPVLLGFAAVIVWLFNRREAKKRNYELVGSGQ